MDHVMIRPDLRTSGGEVNDILIGGKYAGTLTLVYRERERMSGAIQLEKESLTKRDKQAVMDYTRGYVQSLIDAYQVDDCDVVVTYSTYDHVIVTDNNLGVIESFVDDDEDLEYVTDMPSTYEVEEEELDMYQLSDRRGNKRKPFAESDRIIHRKLQQDGRRYRAMDDDEQTAYYELVIVGEGTDTVEYHVYDRNQDWIAEAYMTIYDTDVVGDVHWRFEPSTDEIEHVTDLIISDFDEDQIETFSIDMKYQEDVIETIELTHEDLQDEMDAIMMDEEYDSSFKAILARDDGDTLTYEVYEQTHGGLPICTATVDISTRDVTGFIDLRNHISEDDREQIATVLLSELDKEREYTTVNLSMLHNNELIEEVMFEMDQVH